MSFLSKGGAIVRRVPRTIRLLAQHGVAAMQARIDKGRYIAPLIKRRFAANLRKRAIIDGTFGSFSLEKGGWDPAWDVPRRMFALRGFKGHVRDRNRPERAGKVTKAMAGMDDRLEKQRQEVQERRPKKDLVYMFKRVAELNSKNSRPSGAATTTDKGGGKGKKGIKK